MPTILEMMRSCISDYIKSKYTEILLEQRKRTLERGELEHLIGQCYKEERIALMAHVRKTLKAQLGVEYNSMVVESMLMEIFDDEDLAKRRLVMEIENYQATKKQKTRVYQVQLAPHPKHGTGMQLGFEPGEVVVVSFKKNPDNGSNLPAEDSISCGDTITEINDTNIEHMSREQSIVCIQREVSSSRHRIQFTLRTFDERREAVAATN